VEDSRCWHNIRACYTHLLDHSFVFAGPINCYRMRSVYTSSFSVCFSDPARRFLLLLYLYPHVWQWKSLNIQVIPSSDPTTLFLSCWTGWFLIFIKFCLMANFFIGSLLFLLLFWWKSWDFWSFDVSTSPKISGFEQYHSNNSAQIILLDVSKPLIFTLFLSNVCSLH